MIVERTNYNDKVQKIYQESREKEKENMLKREIEQRIERIERTQGNARGQNQK